MTTQKDRALYSEPRGPLLRDDKPEVRIVEKTKTVVVTDKKNEKEIEKQRHKKEIERELRKQLEEKIQKEKEAAAWKNNPSSD